MNCEFQSMQIAQQKLSVTRDLQKASQDYQTSLTATKLVWEDMDGNTYDLTYDMMMTPTAINQYDPYLLTDTKGKVVLSSLMFRAAVDAGVIDDDGKPLAAPTMAGRDQFLEKLGVAGQIEGSTIQAIQNLGAAGYTRSGIGGEIYDKSTSNALNTSAFINYMKTATWEEYNRINPNNREKHKDKEKIYNIKFADIIKGTTSDGTAVAGGLGMTLVTSKDLKNDKDIVVTKNGEVLSSNTLNDLTLGDILSGKYTISYKSGDGKSVASALLRKMAEALGYSESTDTKDCFGLRVYAESDSALSQALMFTEAQLNKAESENSGNVRDLIDKANGCNTIVNGSDGKYSVSLTNLLKSFLTNFAIATDGFDCEFTINRASVKESNYVTSDLTYYFLLKNDAAQTDQTMLTADFYNMLYNQICMNGACSDKTIRELATTDKSYLSNALKTGKLFISSLNNDGYFYQGAYTLNGHVGEIPDESAIAQAEAEYNVTKSKLNYKEETLEVQMKNLDTEIAALTSEASTVKQLISKNVEKVFALFSS